MQVISARTANPRSNASAVPSSPTSCIRESCDWCMCTDVGAGLSCVLNRAVEAAFQVYGWMLHKVTGGFQCDVRCSRRKRGGVGR